MFENYTERTRRGLFFAKYHAGLEQSPEVTPRHLMLGLLRAQPNRELAGMFNPGINTSRTDIPYSDETRQVLSRTETLSEDLGFTGNGHLFVAILQTPSSDQATTQQLQIFTPEIQARVLDAMTELASNPSAPGHDTKSIRSFPETTGIDVSQFRRLLHELQKPAVAAPFTPAATATDQHLDM